MNDRNGSRFRATALLGYALVIVLLGSGLALGLGRANALASTGLMQVREAESTATAAEQVRWSAAVVSASGRGYLLLGHPKLLEDLARAEATFDERLRNLEERSRTAQGHERLKRVQRVADDYRRGLGQAIADKDQGATPEQLSAAFDESLQSVRRELDTALDELVADRTTHATDAYRRADEERARWMLSASVLTSVLTALAIGFAWFFSTLLTRAHREEQRALETARSAVRARDELLGIIAHDLRNPLAAISLKAAALRKRLPNADAHELGMSIENIAIRMDLLINGMLDTAVLDAGHFSVSPSRCEVASLVAEAEDMFAGLAAAKNIEWSIAVPSHGLEVRADRERILQVLSNLLGNALKFTPRGGHIALAVEEAGETVCFAVSDDGPGIPRGTQPHVFERFLRAERAGAPGTGLGLFIAKEIVDAHGGRIWVESEPGQGATFYFTLPRERRAPAPSPLIEHASADAEAHE